LNRKKFGACTLSVVSCAPAEPSTNVLSGWSDHDVGVQLLHEPPGLLDGRVGGVVTATHAHELERVVADGAAREPGLRVRLALRLRTGELRQRRHCAGHVLLVERTERALALRHDRELDRRAGAAAARLDRLLRLGPLDARRRGCDRGFGGRSAATAAACVVVVVTAAPGGRERDDAEGDREPGPPRALPSSTCSHLSSLLADDAVNQRVWAPPSPAPA
jgi:hypothetical protein